LQPENLAASVGDYCAALLMSKLKRNFVFNFLNPIIHKLRILLGALGYGERNGRYYTTRKQVTAATNKGPLTPPEVAAFTEHQKGELPKAHKRWLLAFTDENIATVSDQMQMRGPH
jgi:hypothetical protein